MSATVRRRGSAGFTLIECLVAIVILAILMGGITAMATVSLSSSSANRSERVDLLLTAFGESVKNLPYVPCSNGSDYQIAFDATESGQAAISRIVQASAVTLTVGSVSLGVDCPETDPGTQTVPITAKLDGAERSGKIVKRDPSPRAIQLNPTINALLASDANAAQVVYQLDAIGSSPVDRIVSYDWKCDPAAVVQSVTTDDDTVQCVYTAPAAGNPAGSATVSLTVIDDIGRTRTVTKVLAIAPQAAAPQAPTSLFSYSPLTNIVTGQTVTFQSLSTAASGQLDYWEWNFDDGTSVSCTRPDTSCTTVTHKFTTKASFTVRLYVKDSNGVLRQSSQVVEVNDATLFAPIPDFTISPSVRIAPQRVTFDGSPSRDAYGAAVVSYAWNFGDPASAGNNTSTAASPTHDYANAGTYSVTLTVTAANNATKSITKAFVVSPLGLPPGMTMTPYCDSNIFGLCAGGARFVFNWTNVPRPSGESLTYVFVVVKTDACGLANFFGERQSAPVTAGTQNVPQSYTFDYSSPVCSGDFTWSVRTTKTSALGTSNPNQSPQTSFNLG